MSPEMEAQAALARALGPKVVEIEHVPADAIGAAWPIQGVWVARDRVVTAFFAVAGWAASGQRLQVVAGDRRFEAAVGLQDARIGLAVLDVPGLGMPPGGPVAGVAGAKPLLLLHAVQLGGLRRVPLVGFADGERAYYLKAVGAPLPLGAPLFDGAGRWVSLVGLRSEDPSLAGYVLPADAVRRLLAREVEWLP
ncbi:MAG: hypothetical protein KC613_10090 [Myxococcales bacterium]|nr:hypothetical protein [Myxococcales bacterium]